MTLRAAQPRMRGGLLHATKSNFPLVAADIPIEVTAQDIDLADRLGSYSSTTTVRGVAR